MISEPRSILTLTTRECVSSIRPRKRIGGFWNLVRPPLKVILFYYYITYDCTRSVGGRQRMRRLCAAFLTRSTLSS